LVAAFFAAGFFAGAFLVVPVAAFFTAGLEEGFLATAGLAATGFFAGVVFLTAGLAALVAAGLATGFLAAGTFLGAAALGFLFSLLADDFLGASLTLPEEPLGSTNLPVAVPRSRALEIWVFTAALEGSLYLVSMNFLIWGRETPVRALSFSLAMHSAIMSMKDGWAAGAFLEAGFLVVVGLAADMVGKCV